MKSLAHCQERFCHAFGEFEDVKSGRSMDDDNPHVMYVSNVRGEGFKKVQVQIQGEELRVIAPARDTLQDVIAFLKKQDYGMELKFGNYR